jgi:hypothetical protein
LLFGENKTRLILYQKKYLQGNFLARQLSRQLLAPQLLVSLSANEAWISDLHLDHASRPWQMTALSLAQLP